MTRDHSIELVRKVIRVLEAVKDEPTGLPLRQIASRTGYVKSSVHRILLSLKKLGYMEQDSAGGSYKLGLQFLVIASSLVARTELVKTARPYLREIVGRFNESAYLALLQGGKGVFVAVEEATRAIQLAGSLFAEVHFHATAAGKAMAAFFPEEYRTALLRGSPFAAFTPQTKTHPARVARDWEQVRERGYALNNEETVPGAVFLAAPVFDSRECVCGSISVGMPKVRFSPQLSREMAAHLKIVCHRLSDRLRAVGYVHVTGN